MIRKPKVRVLALLLSLALVAGCSAPRPVLTANARTEEVGEAVVEADVEACVALVEKQLEGTGRTGDLVLLTAFMVVGGAAVGAGYGAL